MSKGLAVTLILIVVIVGFAGIVFNISEQRGSIFWESTEEKIMDEDISILVLGRVAEGQGGKWHLAPNLVDAIILINYRPKSDTINLVSLPRDLYGTIGETKFKINEVYSREKVNDLLGELPNIIGIEVDKFLIVDAGIIERVIDALGGIEIELIEPVTDPVGGYRLEKGVHRLTGEDVVWLIRNRYSPEGDFFREKNQQIVIEGIFKQFNSLTPVKKTKFIFSIVPEVKNAEANFSLGELIPQLGDIGNIEFNGIVLDFSTGLLTSSYVPVGGGTPTTTNINTSSTPASYVLIPTEGIDNYSKILEFVSGKIK